MEKWKPLTHNNFENYSISNSGRLKNTNNGGIIKTRIQKKTGLVFCDLSKIVDSKRLRITIYITREVAEGFVEKPLDFNEKQYVPTHKKGISKTNNLARNIEWATFSVLSKRNMAKASDEQRNRLSKHNKEKFKNYKKKKYIKIADRLNYKK